VKSTSPKGKVYYKIKPYIPRRVQIFIRSLFARGKRGFYKDKWPIDESAKIPPEEWNGWPGEKQFAFVLTHDIETSEGLKSCLKIAEIEKKMGFRSAFYFVPKRYDVPSSIIDFLQGNGFEVGVHGLYHDGKLFHTQEIFKKRADIINHYLKQWGAVGFRAPVMHHNLDWLCTLNIKYDASTFDTDPFEPQSDGLGTIFPVKIKSCQYQDECHSSDCQNKKSGYVEFPYTLPQDFSLFILLKEKNIDIWKQKSDWIILHGGMALINTHPDYMSFEESPLSYDKYSYQYYVEFLEYIKTTYKDKYWHALPKDLADIKGITNYNKVINILKANIGMVVFSYFPFDPRVRREAEALANEGYNIDILCLKGPHQKEFEKYKDMNIYHLPIQRNRGSFLQYIREYVTFFVKSFIKLSRLSLSKRYRIIHVHNMPDFLIFTALIPKIFGAKLILDLHDTSPEVYMTKYSVQYTHPIIKCMILIEKICIKFADLVITPNKSFYLQFVTRGCPKKKINIVMNSPDETVFCPVSNKVASHKKTFKIMYHGTIVKRHGLHIALESINRLKDIIPNISFHIYGGGDYVTAIQDLIQDLKLNDIVFYHGEVSLEVIAHAIDDIDIGLIPNLKTPFTEINFPTRIFEYLSKEKPVIVPRTKGILDYFDDDSIFFFDSQNPASLDQVIIGIAENTSRRDEVVANGVNIYKKYCWNEQKHHLVKLVNKVIGVY